MHSITITKFQSWVGLPKYLKNPGRYVEERVSLFYSRELPPAVSHIFQILALKSARGLGGDRDKECPRFPKGLQADLE